MAAPTAIKSILNKKEKKQTKNIAKNQINALHRGSRSSTRTRPAARTRRRTPTRSAGRRSQGHRGRQVRQPGRPRSAIPSSATFVDCASRGPERCPHQGRVLLIGTAGSDRVHQRADRRGTASSGSTASTPAGPCAIGNQYAIASADRRRRAAATRNGFATTVVTASDRRPGRMTFALACRRGRTPTWQFDGSSGSPQPLCSGPAADSGKRPRRGA